MVLPVCFFLFLFLPWRSKVCAMTWRQWRAREQGRCVRPWLANGYSYRYLRRLWLAWRRDRASSHSTVTSATPAGRCQAVCRLSPISALTLRPCFSLLYSR